MQIDRPARRLDLVHAPVVDAKVAGPCAGLGRYGSARGRQRHRLGRFVHAVGQQRDASGQRRLEVALEHDRRHFLVAVALLRDLADTETSWVPGVPGVDLQVLLRAPRMPQFVRHHHALQPGTAHGLAGMALAQEQNVRLHVRRGQAGEGPGAAGSRPAARPGSATYSRTASARASIVPVLVMKHTSPPGRTKGPARARRSSCGCGSVRRAWGPHRRPGSCRTARCRSPGRTSSRATPPSRTARCARRRHAAHTAPAAAGEPVDLDGRDRAALGERAGHGAQEVADAGRGLSTRPPVKPKRSTACHMASIT